MDKNSWIGIILMGVILVVFTLLQRPSQQQIEERRHYNDSITHVRQMEAEAERLSKLIEVEQQALKQQAEIDSTTLKQTKLALYGVFAGAAEGKDEITTIENEVLSLHFINKGGRINQAELKNYKAYGDSVNMLSLFKDQEQYLSFTLLTQNDRILNTNDLYFDAQPIEEKEDGSKVLTMRLNTQEEDSWLDFVYTIPRSDYMVSMQIVAHNMQKVLQPNINYLKLEWNQIIKQQEKGRKFEERYATLQYMFVGQDIENLSEAKAEQKQLNSRLRWIAYKDQFFSTVFIADQSFSSVLVASNPLNRASGYIKNYSTKATVFFDPTGNETTDFRWYLGPNHYNTLKAFDKNVEKENRLYLNRLVPLGWKVVSWINMWLVIPMFDLFTSWGIHIGLIILLMTIVIKIIILPFTFSSYRSSAKMRVLKPQIDAINEKYPPEKMQERQQATMALYKKAGASPMSGCLPMLFQFPVLMAMFWFFPTAIELRGQSFLWADDLSTYDAIISWDRYIPILSWALDNHISLFCLLMTVTNVIYSYLNMQTQSTGNDPTAKMMRWMMYLMPIMFFFIFNDYAAGLSYYYFVSLLMTIIQTYIFRWSINDEKLLKQMEAKAAKNSGKPKKSGLMERLEKMQREQQAYAREQAKKRSRY